MFAGSNRTNDRGRFFVLKYIIPGILFLVTGCSIKSVHNTDTTALSEDMSSGETSLSDDAKSIEELRKNIPEAKRRDNDQLKEILGLMGEVKEPPQRIRDRFHRTTQRIREGHRRDVKRQRDEFNRIEKSARDDFFKKLKDEREENLSNKKLTREERQRFTEDQDRRRREFTGDERDRRQRFNSDLRQAEDDFSANLRDKTTEFNQELRAYTARYNDWQKQLKEKKAGTPSTPAAVSPTEYVPPVTPMKTGDDGK
jgi:hypothetical protein